LHKISCELLSGMSSRRLTSIEEELRELDALVWYLEPEATEQRKRERQAEEAARLLGMSEETAAAMIIGARWRGRAARKWLADVQVTDKEQHAACVRIQRRWRGIGGRKIARQ